VLALVYALLYLLTKLLLSSLVKALVPATLEKHFFKTTKVLGVLNEFSNNSLSARTAKVILLSRLWHPLIYKPRYMSTFRHLEFDSRIFVASVDEVSEYRRKA
jgi:hypothetical protein